MKSKIIDKSLKMNLDFEKFFQRSSIRWLFYNLYTVYCILYQSLLPTFMFCLSFCVSFQNFAFRTKEININSNLPKRSQSSFERYHNQALRLYIRNLNPKRLHRQYHFQAISQPLLSLLLCP